MKWCSQVTKMSVRTNADTPEQTQNAIAFGAVGIGLTHSEHMFFEGDRIDAMREMILADTVEARQAALAKLLPYQREDFFGIFKALKGYLLERLESHSGLAIFSSHAPVNLEPNLRKRVRHVVRTRRPE